MIDFISAYITGIFSLQMAFIAFIIWFITILAMWNILKKAGVSGYKCLIPFYNTYCLFDISFGKGMGWMFLLTFVPCVNVVIFVMLAFKLAGAFGRSAFFALGLLFLPTLFYWILGLGRSSYTGPRRRI